MADNNTQRTIVRKEDLHQEVGTIREANTNGNGHNYQNTDPANGFKQVTEHNYHTTTIVRKEGIAESSNNQSAPDYNAPLPSYLGPATPTTSAEKTESYSTPVSVSPQINHINATSPEQDNTRTNPTTFNIHNTAGGDSKAHEDTHVSSKHPEHSSTIPPAVVIKEKSSSILKALGILCILVALFFISIGIVKFVPKAIGSLSSASVYLSNLFSKDGIELSVDKSTITSGETITISWKNTSEETGLYTWSFACTQGVTVLYRSTNGTLLPVICETSFPLPETEASYSFVVNSTLDKDTTLSMTLALFNKETKKLIYTDTGAVKISKNSVTPPSKPADDTPLYNPSTSTPVLPATTTTITSQKPSVAPVPTAQSIAVGPTDMSISLVEAHAIAVGTTNFTTLSNVGQNDKIVVRFKVANIGAYQTGSWKLTASLPTRILADQAYISKNEPSLYPATSHEMTLMFDAFDTSKNQILITIESANDTNSSNNLLSIPISGSSSNSVSSGSRPDLKVRVLEVGTMNPYSHIFTRSNNLYSNDTVAVRFEIENIGGSSSGYYDLRVDLPTEDDDSKTYRSLSPIAAGGKTEFTVGFDNPDTGSNTIEIRVDPSDDIRENNENNNRTTQSVYINR